MLVHVDKLAFSDIQYAITGMCQSLAIKFLMGVWLLVIPLVVASVMNVLVIGPLSVSVQVFLLVYSNR